MIAATLILPWRQFILEVEMKKYCIRIEYEVGNLDGFEVVNDNGDANYKGLALKYGAHEYLFEHQGNLPSPMLSALKELDDQTLFHEVLVMYECRLLRNFDKVAAPGSYEFFGSDIDLYATVEPLSNGCVYIAMKSYFFDEQLMERFKSALIYKDAKLTSGQRVQSMQLDVEHHDLDELHELSLILSSD